MSHSIFSPTFDWKYFLNQWSQIALELVETSQSNLPKEVYESGWLGYPGATEAQISHVEHRLNVTFPPSYREFLKITNGWRQTTPFINRIWAIEDVEWFSVRHHKWIEMFTIRHSKKLCTRSSHNKVRSHVSIVDQDYFIYGDNQDCSQVRVEYLQTALEISEKGESSIYLLNPQVITEDGEWEAWFFCDWLPGADRYRSFQDMMQAEYRNFLEIHLTELKH